MFKTKKADVREKVLPIRVTIKEFNLINDLMKHYSKRYKRNKANFIRHNIVTSPEYLEYTYQKMLEQNNIIIKYQEYLQSDNPGMKAYWKKYYDREVKERYNELSSLKDHQLQRELSDIQGRALQKGFNDRLKEAKYWRNIYEDALEQFIEQHQRNETLLKRIMQ